MFAFHCTGANALNNIEPLSFGSSSAEGLASESQLPSATEEGLYLYGRYLHSTHSFSDQSVAVSMKGDKQQVVFLGKVGVDPHCTFSLWPKLS